MWDYGDGKKQHRRAFTLIELLVVISIISVLAAILFPVFARARENARRSSCSSNLKQMGLSMMMYAQDHDERITPTWTENSPHKLPNGTYNTQLWYHMLYPYMKNRQIMNCPSAESGVTWSTNSYTGNIPYGINIAGSQAAGCPSNCGINMAPSKAAGASLGEIEDTAGTILIMDARYYNLKLERVLTPDDALSAPGSLGRCRELSGSGTADPSRCFAPRHLETGNVLFVDGHVKSIPWQRVVGSSDSYKLWVSTVH